MVQQSMTRYTPLSSIVAARLATSRRQMTIGFRNTMVGSPFYSGGDDQPVTSRPRSVTHRATAPTPRHRHKQAKSGVTVSHILTDNGSGFLNSMGAVSYAGKTVTVKVVQDYAENSYSQNYEQASAWESLVPPASAGVAARPRLRRKAAVVRPLARAATTVLSRRRGLRQRCLLVRYRTSARRQHRTPRTSPPADHHRPVPVCQDIIVPGSVRFVWMGTTYDDFEGKIYRGRTEVNRAFIAVASPYSSGIVTMFDYIVGGSPVVHADLDVHEQRAAGDRERDVQHPAAPVKAHRHRALCHRCQRSADHGYRRTGWRHRRHAHSRQDQRGGPRRGCSSATMCSIRR